MGPQTIGPFETSIGRFVGRRSLRRAALVLSRDTVSASYAAALGRSVDASVTDVVFALPPPEPSATRHDVIVNVSGLLWQENKHVDSANYRDQCGELVQRLQEQGREVSLLAHVGEGSTTDDDVPAVRALAALFSPNVKTILPASLADARANLSRANLVIAPRMHACLNALSCGVPVISLGYSRKAGPLLEDLGWDASVDIRADRSWARTVLATESALEREPGLEREREPGQAREPGQGRAPAEARAPPELG